ncbi:MAG: lactoylglutathione lyase, partial [Actinomycetota bacterium]|nr:lactoylglutathione lyase [Actinomycetota bacterium]
MTEASESKSWPGAISAVTLFVEDLPATRQFYLDIFDLPIHYEDDDSAVFKLGDILINLLKIREAPDLIAPAVVAPADSGARFQFTIEVDDVDATCAELVVRGVELLNGPM